jgi:hypothetical protein
MWCLRAAVVVSARAGRLNNARIPSIADDVTTDLITMVSRTAGLRRYGFVDESFVLIRALYLMANGVPRNRLVSDF